MKPCSHSAPSVTAATCPACSSPRRCISSSVACSKPATSASREQYERCSTRASPASFTATSPTTSVLTSAHSPPTRGPIAPAALITCWRTPAGAAGRWWWRAAVWSSHSCTPASPACKVNRRALALLPCTPTSASSSWAAGPKGTQLARRTNPSWAWGVNSLPVRSNSSSRGKKPLPALRTGSIAPFELDLLPSTGLQPAALFASTHQHASASLTPRAALRGRLAPIRLRTHLDQLFQHPRSQFRQPLIHGLFDLSQARVRMLLPPFLHPRQHHQRLALFASLGVPLAGPFPSHSCPPPCLVPLVYHVSPLCKTLNLTQRKPHPSLFFGPEGAGKK